MVASALAYLEKTTVEKLISKLIREEVQRRGEEIEKERGRLVPPESIRDPRDSGDREDFGERTRRVG